MNFEALWGDGSKEAVQNRAAAAAGTATTMLVADAAVAAGCTAAACTVAAPLVAGVAAAAATVAVVGWLWDEIF